MAGTQQASVRADRPLGPSAGRDHTPEGRAGGARGIGGGFVEADASSTFTTALPSPSMSTVTEQTVTLFENGTPVDSFLCSTGSSGTDTPLGDYTIYAKLPSIDMRGPGYFAPKVPWVMVSRVTIQCTAITGRLLSGAVPATAASACRWRPPSVFMTGPRSERRYTSTSRTSGGRGR